MFETRPLTDEELAQMRQSLILQDRHARSLGLLCMTWAALDRLLDDLFEPLLQCGAAEVASIVTNVENVSARYDILKRLLTNSAPSPKYREWLTGILDRVSGELAPLRNRYVHDHWTVSKIEIVRTDKRAKIGRGQAREPEQLTFDTRHVTAPHEVELLTHKTGMLLAMLAYAEHDLRVWRRTGQPLKPQPEHAELSKRNARWLTPENMLKRLPEGSLHLRSYTTEPFINRSAGLSRLG